MFILSVSVCHVITHTDTTVIVIVIIMLIMMGFVLLLFWACCFCCYFWWGEINSTISTHKIPEKSN